jgi:tetratricopeptide (TPR) repeat protein
VSIGGPEPLTLGTVMLVAATHAGAPSHWAPFVLVGRTHRWSRRKVLAVTAAAAAGHALVTAMLGGAVGLLGHEVLAPAEAYGERITSFLLLLVGTIYVVLGVRGRAHEHRAKVCEGGAPGHTHPFIVLSLVSMLSLSPCMAVAVAFLAAASYATIAAMAVAYAAVTVISMTLIVSIAMAGAQKLRLNVLERHGQLITGVLLALLGLGVVLSGCKEAKPPPLPKRPAPAIRDDEALMERARSSPIGDRVPLCERVLRDYADGPFATEAAYVLGQDYQALGRVEDARAIHEQIVKRYRHPTSLSTSIDYLVRYWESMGSHETAIPYLKEGVTECRRRLEERPAAWLEADGVLLGDYLVGLDQLEESAAAYRRVLEEASASRELASLSPLTAAERLSALRLRQGDRADARRALDEAERLLERLSLSDPDRAQLLENLHRMRHELESAESGAGK